MQVVKPVNSGMSSHVLETAWHAGFALASAGTTGARLLLKMLLRRRQSARSATRSRSREWHPALNWVEPPPRCWRVRPAAAAVAAHGAEMAAAVLIRIVMTSGHSSASAPLRFHVISSRKRRVVLPDGCLLAFGAARRFDYTARDCGRHLSSFLSVADTI
jgi:hypothetical protein